MQNMTTALPLLALLLLAALPAPGLAGDFRNADWGMSKEEVKAAESLALVQETVDRLFYSTTLLGADVEVRYDFIENTLVSAYYGLERAYSHAPSFYLRYFNDLTDGVKEKYGPPMRDAISGISDDMSDNPKTWEAALAARSFLRLMTWETQEIFIAAGLNGARPDIRCFVIYAPKKYEHLRAEQYQTAP